MNTYSEFNSIEDFFLSKAISAKTSLGISTRISVFSKSESSLDNDGAFWLAWLKFYFSWNVKF